MAEHHPKTLEGEAEAGDRGQEEGRNERGRVHHKAAGDT